MDLVSYGVERCIDVAAALLFRFGLKFVDRFFVSGSASVNGRETGVMVAVVDVPFEDAGEPGAVVGSEIVIGSGSVAGAGLVAVAGAGSGAGASVGNLPDDYVVSVAGADPVDGALVGGQPDDCVVDGFEVALGSE